VIFIIRDHEITAVSSLIAFGAAKSTQIISEIIYIKLSTSSSLKSVITLSSVIIGCNIIFYGWRVEECIVPNKYVIREIIAFASIPNNTYADMGDS